MKIMQASKRRLLARRTLLPFPLSVLGENGGNGENVSGHAILHKNYET